MKSLIRSSAVLFVLFVFSILICSCSQESGITSPNLSSSGSMAKSAVKVASVTTPGKIDHSADTVITLPISKKTLVIPKKFPAKRLVDIDNYLTTHTISTSPSKTTSALLQANSVCPTCSLYYEYFWELQNQYKLAPGYNAGIWVENNTNVINWYQAFNQYGFNELLIGFGDIATAKNIGFQYANLMVALSGNEPTAMEQMQYAGKYPAVGAYFVDEPNNSTNDWSTDEMSSLSANIQYYYPNAKLVFSDYYWPYWDVYCATTSGDYNTISGYLGNPNSWIMSDIYYGNGCGNMKAFWNEYFNTYNPHSMFNWMGNTVANSSQWSDCFDWMNAHSLNNVWLYADNTGDSTVVQQWCHLAWQKYWMLEYDLQLVIVCANTDCTCDWENGQWIVEDMYYDASLWTYY